MKQSLILINNLTKYKLRCLTSSIAKAET